MKLCVDLKNCYGISELVHEFDFNITKGYAIYAPNGFMKTSLSKSFDDLAKGRDTKDLIFPDRASSRVIKDHAGNDIAADSVFVVEPYNADFSSEMASLLLVNSGVKQKYDDAIKEITDKQSALFVRLKQLSGLTGRTVTPEIEILKCFGKKSLAELVEFLEEQVKAGTPSQLSTVVYAEVFNDRTVGFLESGSIKDQLEEYINKYNELISKSDVLSKQFNHHSASTVNKQLKENGFFEARHTVNLRTKDGMKEVSTTEELAEKIEDERKKILTDKDLASKFDAIDKKVLNAELRKFRDYLFDNQYILPYLKDFKRLQKDLWISYLVDQKELYNQFLEAYKASKVTIEEAIEQAKSERTEWEAVVEVFSKRFTVPFKMSVSNQDDVILKGSQPSISFKFSDGDGEGDISKDSLLKVLSQGERRALYILNILFEIETRRKQGATTILVIDDIADSFDYKNKYAIIEYLKDISESGQFLCLFLSHNFDFYRSISGRLGLRRECKLHAAKTGRKLKLIQEKYQKNPFNHWKDNLTTPVFCISAIPFVRNLAEYCGLNVEFLKLTSLLHVKADTDTMTLDELCTIYKKILADKQQLTLNPPAKPVIDLINEEAESVFNAQEEAVELEGKIVLSIAIRLIAERHMIRVINNAAFVGSIKENQTIKLLQEYKRLGLGRVEDVLVLEQVNLMTPENIHLNSFMYEPILDLGITHLKTLYSDVKQLP
jgi:energy-coupling factor transporter ATP-binding protein EcfA2